MRVRAISDPDFSQAYVFVKFDVSAFAGCTIQSSSLKLRAFNDSVTGFESSSGRNIQVFQAPAAWTEADLDWAKYSTMGSPVGTAVNYKTVDAPNANSGTAGPATYTWAVKDHATAMLTTNNGFFIKDELASSSNGNEGSNQWWRTREWGTASERPILTITL